jgi:hypothetical protein
VAITSNISARYNGLYLNLILAMTNLATVVVLEWTEVGPCFYKERSSTLNSTLALYIHFCNMGPQFALSLLKKQVAPKSVGGGI